MPAVDTSTYDVIAIGAGTAQLYRAARAAQRLPGTREDITSRIDVQAVLKGAFPSIEKRKS